MEKNDVQMISYFIHEGEMTRMERVVRWFAIVTLCSLAVTLGVVIISNL